MGDFVATRDMEEFLINPTTIKMQDQHDESRTSTLTVSSQDVISIRRSLKLLPTANETHKKQPLRSRISSGDLLAEHLYWRGYCSDEEAFSPTDSDTMSISSASSGEIIEAVPTRLSLVLPEEITQSFRNIDRQLHRAHAVVLRPIGKASSPTSPRIIDIPPSPRLQRQSPTSPFRPPASRPQRPDLVKDNRRDVSAASTPRTSSEKYAVSIPTTPPTSMDERSPGPRHVLRKKPTMPSMRVPKASMPATVSSKSSETMLEFLKSNDPYPLADQIRDHIVAPMTPTRRKLRKFSSSFSIGRFNGNSKRKDSADSSADESYNARASIASARPKPEVYIPTRTNPSAKPKMVARGASERAPVLVLPPCPADWEEEQGQLRPGTPRSSPKSYNPTGAPRKLHRQQWSSSADDVMLVD